MRFPSKVVGKSALAIVAVLTVLAKGTLAQPIEPDQWNVDNFTKDSPHWTSVAFFDSLSGMPIVLWCTAAREAVGFQFGALVDNTSIPIDQLDTLNLTIDGQEFSIPAAYSATPFEEQISIGITPQNVPNEERWDGQDVFLNAISAARYLILETATSSSNRALSVEIDQPLRLNGCTSDRFNHLANLCGVPLVSGGGFCRDFFCKPTETALNRLMLALEDGQPQLFDRPNDELVELADEIYSTLGHDGVLGFVETMCFSGEE